MSCELLLCSISSIPLNYTYQFWSHHFVNEILSRVLCCRALSGQCLSVFKKSFAFSVFYIVDNLISNYCTQKLFEKYLNFILCICMFVLMAIFIAPQLYDVIHYDKYTYMQILIIEMRLKDIGTYCMCYYCDVLVL